MYEQADEDTRMYEILQFVSKREAKLSSCFASTCRQIRICAGCFQRSSGMGNDRDQNIYGLMDIAIEAKDFATQQFSMVPNEQIEEKPTWTLCSHGRKSSKEQDTCWKLLIVA